MGRRYAIGELTVDVALQLLEEYERQRAAYRGGSKRQPLSISNGQDEDEELDEADV